MGRGAGRTNVLIMETVGALLHVIVCRVVDSAAQEIL